MEKNLFTTLFFLVLHLYGSAQVAVVNKKGTVTEIDSSKWTLSGANIFNKNTGNVGLGNPSPTYKLDVTGKARITDSLVTNTARVNTLNSGTINDSIVVADPATGILKRIAPARLNKVDSTTASNGLTLTGKNVALGGSLTAATTITTTATNTLAVTGLQSGSNSDSLVVWDPSTGILKKAQQHAPIYIKTTVTQSNSSNTVFLNVNTLQFTTVAGYEYDVTVYLLYNSAATGTGIRLRLNPYSGGNIYYEIIADQSGTTQQGILGYNSTDVLVATGSRKTVGNLAKIKAHIECTSNATFSFQFASEVSGSAITIQPNAHLQYVILD